MMERPKRICSPTASTSTISKKQRSESTDLKTSITTFEDLSNELIYHIFDYMDYTLIFLAFTNLNKRFSNLMKHYPSPMIVSRAGLQDEIFHAECHFIIIPQQHQIWSIQLLDNVSIDIFFDAYFIDGFFPRLESVTLKSIEPRSILSILSHLQTLPSLYRLSLEIDILWKEPPDMKVVYQRLLSFKYLKYLKVSTSYPISDDTFYIYLPSIPNQEPSNLEYLVVDHLIGTGEILSIIEYTPKLRHLCLKSANISNIYRNPELYKIPKLPQLTKLIVQETTITVEDLELLLNAFDCRLKTLEIETYSYSSFCIDDQWKKLMNTVLSDLDIFEICFSKLYCSSIFYEEEEDDDDDDEDRCRIQSSMNFVSDPFWYDHGWMAQIYVYTASVRSLFRRSKSFDAVNNHQPGSQLQKLIHFNNQHYQLNCFLSSSYRLTLCDNLENIGDDHFLNSTANISYLPIKQLMIKCSKLSILNLIMILKKLPHMTFLSIDAESISEIDDQKNESINADNRFDNIDQLEINAKLPWEVVTYLIKYFPKLIDLHVYCGYLDKVLYAILGSFPFNDLAGAEFLRRVNLMKKKEEEEENARKTFISAIQQKISQVWSRDEQ